MVAAFIPGRTSAFFCDTKWFSDDVLRRKLRVRYGAMNEVKRVRRKSTGEYLAIKVISLDKLGENERR